MVHVIYHILSLYKKQLDKSKFITLNIQVFIFTFLCFNLHLFLMFSHNPSSLIFPFFLHCSLLLFLLLLLLFPFFLFSLKNLNKWCVTCATLPSPFFAPSLSSPTFYRAPAQTYPIVRAGPPIWPNPAGYLCI